MPDTVGNDLHTSVNNLLNTSKQPIYLHIHDAREGDDLHTSVDVRRRRRRCGALLNVGQETDRNDATVVGVGNLFKNGTFFEGEK